MRTHRDEVEWVADFVDADPSGTTVRTLYLFDETDDDNVIEIQAAPPNPTLEDIDLGHDGCCIVSDNGVSYGTVIEATIEGNVVVLKVDEQMQRELSVPGKWCLTIAPRSLALVAEHLHVLVGLPASEGRTTGEPPNPSELT